MTPDTTPDDIPLLTEPAGGVPDLVDTPEALDEVIDMLASNEGPVAIDAERAQGYVYHPKAYLLQIKRGSTIAIVDPIAFESEGTTNFSALYQAAGDAEWLIHAASQDLPNLYDLHMPITSLFDTELAGRLLGLPKVGLAAMVERYCGVRLLKEHSTVNWSKRPLPSDWLAYAALDVELLSDLREALAAELEEAGKSEWARQEFAWECEAAAIPPTPRPDPWRRTSGIHDVTTRRGMALVRELWLARDDTARELDKCPTKLLHDKAISELAALMTKEHPHLPSMRELRSIDGFRWRYARKYQDVWSDALAAVADMPEDDYPSIRAANEGLPSPRQWEKARPDAWRRWTAIRPMVVDTAHELNLPVENLLTPSILRDILWDPPVPSDEDALTARLRELGARPWQCEIIAPLLSEQLA